MQPALQKIFIQRSPQAIEDAFTELARNWTSNAWISPRNTYRLDCVQTLTQQFSPGKTVKHKHLREYIAASVLVHCMDSWTFLGRAIGAQLSGDNNAARHLGYYSELRAAMAILAAHGVGVFSQEHVIVNSKGKCLRIAWSRNKNNKPTGPGTHQFVWQALQEWANSTDAVSTVLGCVRVAGEPLSEWLRHFANTPALTQVLSSQWLLTWGLDLGRFADDRDSRNIASYRPSAFSTARPPEVSKVIEIVSSLWKLCEPNQDTGFAELDRQLLSVSLNEAFRLTHYRSPRHAKKQFKLRIQALLKTYLKPAKVPGVDLEDYLLTPPRRDLGVLWLASQKHGPDHNMHSLHVLCRSLLLLRIATGAASKLFLKLPRASRDGLNYWFEIIGQDHSLWNVGNSPASLLDLWQDPQDALTNLATGQSFPSYFEFWRRHAHSASILSSCERIGLWGIAA